MSTRAQIAIQIGPEEWAHVYCHYDGYPLHMLTALAAWTPEDIHAAREIRQVRTDGIEAFDQPREPVILPRPTCQFCHLGPLKNLPAIRRRVPQGTEGVARLALRSRRRWWRAWRAMPRGWPLRAA